MQGGYVLYKLFRKSDERAPGQAEEAELTNVDEMERSGFSPAPSRSSPGEVQQDGDTLDEITAPGDSKSFVQMNRLNLPNSRWVNDRTDFKPAKQDENSSNSTIGRPINMVRSFSFSYYVLYGPDICMSDTI
jgi:hypothetical protein